MTVPPDFDMPMTNVFKEKRSFALLYDTVDGATTPRVPDSEFSVGGLAFNMNAQRLNDPDFPFAVALKLSEASEKTLADGYEIFVKKYVMDYVTEEGNTGAHEAQQFSFPMKEDHLLGFKAPIDRFDVELEMDFHDIFPHRLQFVDEEAALKKMADYKIVLVDDGDKEVFVHKSILSLRSTFFYKIFYGDIKERNRNVIQLEGVTETDFLEYLYRVYPEPMRPFAFKRIETIATLADRYQNTQLMLSIRKFLSEKKDKTAKEKRVTLIVAEANRMSRLFNETLKTMTATDLKKLDAKTLKKFKKENLELLVAYLLAMP